METEHTEAATSIIMQLGAVRRGGPGPRCRSGSMDCQGTAEVAVGPTGGRTLVNDRMRYVLSVGSRDRV